MATFQEQLETDLDGFINPDEFAIPGTYNAVKESQIVIVNGLWDIPFETVDPGTGQTVQSNRPTFRMKTHEIPGGKVRPGDFINISGKDFIIKEDQPDGVGTTVLLLKVK